MKNIVAVILYYLGISWLLFHISRWYYGNAHIRVINYHSTPALYNEGFRRQMEFYKKYYCDVKQQELISFFETKEWPKSNPGLIISFDDGLMNNVQNALPQLEAADFTGWFCVPTEFHQIADAEQYDYAKGHSLNLVGINPSSSAIAIGAPELKELSRNHEILAHTHSHRRMDATFDNSEDLKREILASKNLLEDIIQKEVGGFCWVGGELSSYSKVAQDVIKEHYKYSFQTNNLPITSTTDPYSVNRTNIETWFDFPLFLLTLSGFYDLLYTSKRRKVAEILKSIDA